MSLLKITRGKRGFKVMTDNGNIKRRLELYGEDLIQPKIERQRGKVTVVPGDKFYVYSERHRTFYFINSHYHSVMEVIDSYTRGSGLGNVEIAPEEFPTYESQSNGETEGAVRIIQGQTRALRSQLEAHYGIELPRNSAVVPWLINYAADTGASSEMTAKPRIRGCGGDHLEVL